MKKVLLISPFPPAQNPRLVKEYNSLIDNGYEVKVLYAERDQWASAQNSALNEDFVLVGGKYGSLFHYFTRLIHKLAKLLLPYAYSYNRVSLFLLFKALNTKADLYIGHDLASLPIAVIAARKNNAKCGFDAEDFHRNEVSDDSESIPYKAAKKIEDSYLKDLDYMTAASPLISSAYRELYPFLEITTINNVFSNKYIKETNIDNHPLFKLFWFSQTVGKNRGLETVIEAIGKLNQKEITLTLLGLVSQENKLYFEEIAQNNKLQPTQIKFLNPVSPSEIFEIANKHHIGLALEPGFSLNNNIALSNKLFTYLIAGLAIIASDTPAQKDFLDQNPDVGKYFPINDVTAMSNLISLFYTDRRMLRQIQINAKKLAITTFNWETESKKLLSLINKTFKN